MSNYVYYNGELHHYGVLGMKWGVRRAARKEIRSNYKKTKQKAYDDYSKKISKSTTTVAEMDKYTADYKKAKQQLKSEYKSEIAKTKPDPNSKASRMGKAAIKGLLGTAAVYGVTVPSANYVSKKEGELLGLVAKGTALAAVVAAGIGAVSGVLVEGMTPSKNKKYK